VPPPEGAGQASSAGQASGALQLEGKIVELSFEQDPIEGGNRLDGSPDRKPRRIATPLRARARR